MTYKICAIMPQKRKIASATGIAKIKVDLLTIVMTSTYGTKNSN